MDEARPDRRPGAAAAAAACPEEGKAADRRVREGEILREPRSICHFAESIVPPILVPENDPPYAKRLAALRKLSVAA